jgi:hypothetical protein
MQLRNAVIATLALPLALAAAGCGSGSNDPSVASLGSGQGTTAQSGSGNGSSPGGTANSGSGGGGQLTLRTQNAAQFSACMRSHGVKNFPDPDSHGGISIGSSSGIDPNSHAFQAAQQACQKLLPHGGQPSAAQIAKAQQQALAFSACMRHHGLPDFPDPDFSAGRIEMRIKASPGSDLNPSSPKFQAAQHACQGKLPGKLGGK